MNTLARNIGGFYLVVLTQMFGWLVTIALLSAGATALASAYTNATSVADSLVVGSWIAILLGGPVAIAATAVCLRRFLSKDEPPSFLRTGRLVVTGIWLMMAVAAGAATDSVIVGIPWYGTIAAGIWSVAPLLFRLAPNGAGADGNPQAMGS